jgi:hypothetical protein
MARSGEAGQFDSRRDCFERIGLELQTMRANDEPDADGVDEFACRNESGMADDDDETNHPETDPALPTPVVRGNRVAVRRAADRRVV